jgi:protein gp37|tara:strand:- start:287 stop:937 length:651 start_codon:yes stop_codon:yes gene_type:complete
MNIPQGEILNWPVVTGCYRLSEGCNSCPSYWEYMEEGRSYDPVEHPEILEEPLMNPKPSTYEVAFGSDLFHGDITLAFQQSVFEIMNKAHWHRFSVGTKRVARMHLYSPQFTWTDNIIATVPIESGEYEWRIDILKKLPAKTKVISMAPILGPFSTDIDFEGIDAVGIVPETWGYKRPYDPEWGENIRRQCLEQEVSFGTESILYVKEGQKAHAIR